MSRRINPKPEFAMQQRVEQLWGAFEYPDIDPNQLPFELAGGGGGDPSILIAASDATPQSKEMAHYIATGANDDVLINTALGIFLNDGPSQGGRVVLSEGNFYCTPGEIVATDRMHIHGLGHNRTAIRNNAVGTSSTSLVTAQTAAGVSNLSILTENSYAGIALTADFASLHGIRHAGPAHQGIAITGGQQPMSDLRLNGDYAHSGLYVNGDNVNLTNVIVLRVASTGPAVFIDNSTANASTITGLVVMNQVSGAGGGIQIDAGEVVVSGFAIVTQGESGITIDNADVFDCVFSDGYIEADYGVRMINTGIVTNTRFSDLVIKAAVSGMDMALVFQSLISGVAVYDAGEHAFLFDNCDNNTISNCVAYQPGRNTDNTYDGFIFSNDSDENHIHGNHVIPASSGNATRYGINISAATCDDNAVYANYLGATADYGTGDLNDAGTGTLTAPAANGQFVF